MKHRLLFLFIVVSVFSFGKNSDSKLFGIGIPLRSATTHRISMNIPVLSYWQYLQLPTSYSYVHRKELKYLQTDNVFPLFQLNHDASVNIFLDEREILEIMSGRKTVYDFEVTTNPLTEESIYSAIIRRPRPSTYNPFFPSAIPVISSDEITSITTTGIVSAQVVSILINSDCMKRAGVLGTEHCSKTVVYELVNSKDIEIFGKYVQTLVSGNSSEYVGQLTSLKLSKYTDGHIDVSPFFNSSINRGIRDFYPSKYYLGR